MFTTPCFIKRISSSLKERLKNLGYRDAGKVRYYGESHYIYCEGGIFYESPCIIEARYNTFIDCGTNEDLFLSLAALRDDTDVKQWFILDYGFQKTWVFSETKQFDINHPLVLKVYKATVEELIKHFKEE